MVDNIFIRSWKKENNTPVRDKEIVTVRKEKALYIGTPDNPIKVGDANWEDKINDLYQKLDNINARIDAMTPNE